MSERSYLGEFEQLVLLAVYRLGEEAYGMTVRKEIEACTGRSVSIGALYATLERLERKGYVRPRPGAPTAARGGRAKRYFRLAPAGSRALRQSRAMLDSMWDGVELEEWR